MLCSTIPLLAAAQKENYAVIAANVLSFDSVSAVLKAAENKRSAIILGFSPAVLPQKEDFDRLVSFARYCGRSASIPVAIHLDHGKTLEQCAAALSAGCTSLMIDRSLLPLEENIREVAELVRFAHAAGVSVEAELGHVGVAENYQIDRSAYLTVPAEAERFIRETQVDSLAVAIGTAHGLYPPRFTPQIDFDRLAQLRSRLSVPLVLHGGSGNGREQLSRAARSGISKINIFSDMLHNAAEKVMENRDHAKRDVLLPGWWAEEYQRTVEAYMDIFGSSGKYPL